MRKRDDTADCGGILFVDLTPAQQDSARARFLDAGPSDCKVYQLDRAGRILSRCARNSSMTSSNGNASDGRK